MKTRNNIIGILGGIGPEATGKFYLSLINKLQKSKQIKSNLDFPQIIINSIPAPELIYEKISKKDLIPYIKGIKELERYGSDFIIMVCNTIHLFLKRLEKETNIPIIDLREEVKQLLKEIGVRSTIVIGTPGVINGGLYKYKNIRTHELSKSDIDRIIEAIFKFNRGINKDKQAKIVKNIVSKHMKRTKAQLIIAGCTEISLMLQETELPVLDTMDVLLEAVLKRLDCF